MPRYVDLVTRIVPQLRHALMQPGQPPPTIDEGYVEQCLFEVLAEVTDRHDLDAFVRFDQTLFTTATGQRSYPLPADFGRLLTFEDPLETGIRLYDGTVTATLRYDHVLALVETKASDNGRPGRFVLTADGMTLDPPPDANGSVGSYTVKGTYLQKMDLGTFDMQQECRLAAPHALQNATMALYLGQDLTGPLSLLINGELRQRQKFQHQLTPHRYRHWRRQGRR